MLKLKQKLFLSVCFFTSAGAITIFMIHCITQVMTVGMWRLSWYSMPVLISLFTIMISSLCPLWNDVSRSSRLEQRTRDRFYGDVRILTDMVNGVIFATSSNLKSYYDGIVSMCNEDRSLFIDSDILMRARDLYRDTLKEEEERRAENEERKKAEAIEREEAKKRKAEAVDGTVKSVLDTMSKRFPRLHIDEVLEEVQNHLNEIDRSFVVNKSDILPLIHDIFRKSIVKGKCFESTGSVVFDSSTIDTSEVDAQFGLWKDEKEAKLRR